MTTKLDKDDFPHLKSFQLGVINTVVNLQLSFCEISIVCSNGECVKSEYIMFLAIIACRWNNPKQNMSWSPDSSGNAEVRICSLCLKDFMMFL